MSDNRYKYSILVCIQVIICVCLLVGLLKYLAADDNYEIAKKIEDILTDSEGIHKIEQYFLKLKSIIIYAILNHY